MSLPPPSMPSTPAPPAAPVSEHAERYGPRVQHRLGPGERIVAYESFWVNNGRGMPTPDGAAPGTGRRALGCVADTLTSFPPPFVHGRTVSGAPGTMAMRLAAVGQRHVMGCLVTDRRVLFVAEHPLRGMGIVRAALGQGDPVELMAECPRTGVVNARRQRRGLSGARLRVEFADGSWLIARCAGFPGGGPEVNRLVAALR